MAIYNDDTRFFRKSESQKNSIDFFKKSKEEKEKITEYLSNKMVSDYIVTVNSGMDITISIKYPLLIYAEKFIQDMSTIHNMVNEMDGYVCDLSTYMNSNCDKPYCMYEYLISK